MRTHACTQCTAHIHTCPIQSMHVLRGAHQKCRCVLVKASDLTEASTKRQALGHLNAKGLQRPPSMQKIRLVRSSTSQSCGFLGLFCRMSLHACVHEHCCTDMLVRTYVCMHAIVHACFCACAHVRVTHACSGAVHVPGPNAKAPGQATALAA